MLNVRRVLHRLDLARERLFGASSMDLVLAICAIASIVPLFCARHLPMADLAEHLASMATIRHYGDPAWRSAEYFTIAGIFETPYWFYHATGALLTALLGSAERANVLMLSVTGLAYPYALRSLLLALRGDSRLAIFGCALFWSSNMIVGLLNFVASVPFVFAGLALVVRQAEKPTIGRAIALAVLALSLFYLHLSSFGLFVLDAAVLTWLLPVPTPRSIGVELRRRAVRLPLRLLWLAPSGVLGIVVLLAGRTIAHGKGPTLIFLSRTELVKNLFAWLFDCFKTCVDDVLGMCLVATLVFLELAAAWGRHRAGEVSSFEERWRTRCVRILASIAVVVWFASPSAVGSDARALDVRMAVFVGLFVIMLPRVRPGRPTTFAFAFGGACVLGLAINTASEVHAFERDDVAGFDELLREMPHGKRLVMLNLEPRSTHVKWVHVFSYFGSYYRARYGGVASYSFSETAHWPVQYRPEARPPSRMAWANPCGYRNQHDGVYFDYVLVRGERDPMASLPPGPRWMLVGGSRLWRLYRKSTSEPDIAGGEIPDPGPCG